MALRVAEEAGGLLLERFHTEKEVSFKGRADLVTDVDKLVESRIIEALSAEYPEAGFLAEESEPVKRQL